MRRRHVATIAGVAVAAAIAVAVAVTRHDDSGAPGPPKHSANPARRAPASDSYSNIFADDYAGPTACANCHADKHAQWSASLHRSMNRLAGPETVKATTGESVLEYGGAVIGFERSAGDYVMTLSRAGRVVRQFRVTRTIGVRSLQEYVGVQIEGPEPAGDPVYDAEIRLPFGFWIDRGQWFHQQYFDSWFDAEYTEAGELSSDPLALDSSPWNARCPWCHNTYPFATRAVRAHGEQPRGFGPEQYVELTEPVDPSWRAAVVEHNRLPIDELITVGISCESCHFGGRRHADAGEPMMFWPQSPALRNATEQVPSGGRDSSRVKNTICSQCHSAPSPLFPDGSAVRNSREALDMISGSCASAIACTDCHDPHVSGSGRGRPDVTCVRCHEHLAGAGAATAHSRHSDDVGCADCHMPRIVQGITAVVRSHHISSPGDGGMMGPSAPNACNLCHVDRSTAWVVEQLAEGWSVEIAADTTAEPAGRAWLRADSRDTRLVAIDALSRSGRSSLPLLLEALDQPVAYDRMRAVFAVEAVLGRRLTVEEYDSRAAPAVRSRQGRSLAKTLLRR